jgi:hypothetical protein
MDDDQQVKPPPEYHRFGPAAGNEMSTQAMLTGIKWLFEHNQQAFADMVLAINGLDFGTGRPKRNSQNGHGGS